LRGSMSKFPLMSVCALLLSQMPVAAAAELILADPSQAERSSRTVPPRDGELIRTIEQGGFVAKIDVSGKGAVLCMWSITVIVQAYARGCGWDEVPTDDAIRASIAEMDAFILDNSLTPVTQADLDRSKQAEMQRTLDFIAANTEAACKRGEGEFADSAWAIRQETPEQIAAGTADMLSLPREPVMNPCL